MINKILYYDIFITMQIRHTKILSVLQKIIYLDPKFPSLIEPNTLKFGLDSFRERA